MRYENFDACDANDEVFDRQASEIPISKEVILKSLVMAVKKDVFVAVEKDVRPPRYKSKNKSAMNRSANMVKVPQRD